MNTKVFIVCAIISFSLSIAFWLFWGSFELFGFIVWSLVSALAGLLKFCAMRYVLKRMKWQPSKILRFSWGGAIAASIFVRIAIFALSLYS